MSLMEMRVVDLLAAIRSPDPTPGGGSASALAGALGAGLLAMVAAMPKHRAPTAGDAGRLHDAARRCVVLCDRLAALVDRDTDAYCLVLAAYRLPRGPEAERSGRRARIQDALKEAAAAPLETMKACRSALDEAAVVAAFGNPNASSDVGVARELLTAGLRGAWLNVGVNLDSIEDQAYVASVRQEAGRLAGDGGSRGV